MFQNKMLYCPCLFFTPRQSCLMSLILSVLACLCLLLTDRTKEEPSTSTHAATPRPLLWCRPEPSMCHAHTISMSDLVSKQSDICEINVLSLFWVFTFMLQLHRGEDGAEAASWDGFQRKGCERCALPVSRHWWQSGRLHSSGGPGTQGRGKSVFTESWSFLTSLLQITQSSWCLMTTDLIIHWLLLCPGTGMLCHRSVGPLRPAPPWGVWRRHRAGQLPEVWCSSLLRRSSRRLLRCQRQPDPDDAWQNGWSHQVRHDTQGKFSVRVRKRQGFILKAIAGPQRNPSWMY